MNLLEQDHIQMISYFCLVMQLPVGVNDAELEERIIQHLAAAAAMGRARHIARREGQRNRSSGQGRPQFLVFSTHPNAPPATASSSPDQMGEGEQAPSIAVAYPSPPMNVGEETSRVTTSGPSQSGSVSASASGSSVPPSNQHGSSMSTRYHVLFTLIIRLHQWVHKITTLHHFLLNLPLCNCHFPIGGLLVRHPQVAKIELGHQIYNHFQKI